MWWAAGEKEMKLVVQVAYVRNQNRTCAPQIYPTHSYYDTIRTTSKLPGSLPDGQIFVFTKRETAMTPGELIVVQKCTWTNAAGCWYEEVDENI